jgi:hypothetical protein
LSALPYKSHYLNQIRKQINPPHKGKQINYRSDYKNQKQTHANKKYLYNLNPGPAFIYARMAARLSNITDNLASRARISSVEM